MGLGGNGVVDRAYAQESEDLKPVASSPILAAWSQVCLLARCDGEVVMLVSLADLAH